VAAAEDDAEVVPVVVGVPVDDVDDRAVLVELLVPAAGEPAACPRGEVGPHPERARTATPAVTAVATLVFMPL
jgi:hypothetical protein